MDIYNEIKQERSRQKEKWGTQNHNKFKWLAILGEEVGEANEAALESYFGDWSDEKYRKELIQVAAVAHAAIECLNRKNKEG